MAARSATVSPVQPAATAGRLSSTSIAVGAVAMGLPILVFAYFLIKPDQNGLYVLPEQHFFVVSLVALLAVIVAGLVIRAALQVEQTQAALVSVGFMVMAGFFSAHALATPGILLGVPQSAYSAYGSNAATPGFDSMANSMPGMTPGDGLSYNGTVVGVSAFLSLFGAAPFFALSFTRAGARLRKSLPFSPAAGVVGILTILLAYATLALVRSDWVASWPISQPPYSYILAAVCVGLLVWSAWRQGRTYATTRFPTHAALTISFVLLAEAVVLMTVTTFWSLSWWEYHVLMFSATILSLWALFEQLGRRQGLERYLPQEVMERVVAGDSLRLAGERRAVTVLFSDLRGSTALSEQMNAEDVVTLLNDYVGAMANCVFEQSGMLDKFMGDGLMAIFGILPDGSNGAESAIKAALAMRTAIRELNTERSRLGWDPVGFGVGINSGEVVLGSIGIPQRSDFTAVGDVVNTASRLQDLTKTLGVDVAISSTTAERLSWGLSRLVSFGPREIRGRQEPVDVFGVPADFVPSALAPAVLEGAAGL